MRFQRRGTACLLAASILAVTRYAGGQITMICPPDTSTYVDCDQPTAVVTWPSPSASDSCMIGPDPTPSCSGTYPGGFPIPTGVVMNGGVFPIGVSSFSCTAMNGCSESAMCSWDITVLDGQLVDVTIQLSPTITPAEIHRCIEFEFFSDCIGGSTIVEEVVTFGGMFNFPGHGAAQVVVPTGQYLCVVASDPLHTHHSVSMVECIDGDYYATFQGDPFFGGNWLTSGNIDRDAGIGILDWVALFILGPAFTTINPDTSCADVANPTFKHADINGDGLLDSVDYAILADNLGGDTFTPCCPLVTAGSGSSGDSDSSRSSSRVESHDDAAAQSAGAPPTVRLELRTNQLVALVGEKTWTVDLYAVSEGVTNQKISAIDAILNFDALLELSGSVAPCDSPTCPPNTHDWLVDTVVDDCGLDGLNAPCTGFPITDGNAFFTAWRELTVPVSHATATPSGLHVASFQFDALSPGAVEAALISSAGTYTQARVIGGDLPGSIVTGSLGSPVGVDVLPTDSNNDLDPGVPDTLNPSGGSGDPTVDAQVVIENTAGPANAMALVGETTQDIHPGAGGFVALGTTLVVQTSLNNGQFRMTVAAPFDATALAGADPMSVELTWFDGADWVLAVSANTQPSPGHEPSVIGDRAAEQGPATPTLASLSPDLGDYGVFWNTTDLRGFAWANVDHASDFTPGIAPCTADVACAYGNVCRRGTCTDGSCSSVTIGYGDVNGLGGPQADLDDILCALVGFGVFSDCAHADIAGCVRNGVIDLDDILEVLAAFGGAKPCSCAP